MLSFSPYLILCSIDITVAETADLTGVPVSKLILLVPARGVTASVGGLETMPSEPMLSGEGNFLSTWLLSVGTIPQVRKPEMRFVAVFGSRTIMSCLRSDETDL